MTFIPLHFNPRFGIECEAMITPKNYYSLEKLDGCEQGKEVSFNAQQCLRRVAMQWISCVCQVKKLMNCEKEGAQRKVWVEKGNNQTEVEQSKYTFLPNGMWNYFIKMYNNDCIFYKLT